MFRHHPDGLVYIGALVLPLADFLIEEPAYTLPARMISREYLPGVKHTLYDGVSQFAGPLPWADGDRYLANELNYKTAYLFRTEPPNQYSIWNGVGWIADIDLCKNVKARELRNAHAAAYKSGFTSSALGTAHFYSTDNISNRLTSDQIDRDDLQAAILLAMTNRDVPGWSLVYPCRDAAGWARKSHTAAQIIKVGQDGFVAMQDYNIKLTQLLTQMDAATTVAGVEAVVWG